MVATAIAIKLNSKGPVLFKQKRHGFNNEVINVFKFRSMYTEQCDPTARAAGDQGRSARDPGRTVHPQDLDR
jgi:lipopolysaccharide/colanic/teichoic acid biosynthesis glycosyltransferase